MSSAKFDANLEFTSENADVGVKEYRFRSNLDVGLKVDSPSLESGKVDVSGTYFKLQDARLSSEKGKAEPWHASINIEKGTVRLDLEAAEEGVSGAKQFVRAFREKEFKSLLASADEEIR